MPIYRITSAKVAGVEGQTFQVVHPLSDEDIEGAALELIQQHIEFAYEEVEQAEDA
jgi:hypothetical protein